MVKQWGGVINFGRDPLTLSRQTFDDGFGEGSLQGPRRVVWMDDRMSQMHTYDVTSYVDKALMSCDRWYDAKGWHAQGDSSEGSVTKRVFGWFTLWFGEARAAICERKSWCKRAALT